VATTDPAQITFTQTGAGAVARALLGKLGDIVSVADFSGASVTAQIDAAIASLGGAKGVVLIPNGLGAGDPSAVPTNATLIDFRGGLPSANGVTFNGTTGTVHNLMRVSDTRTSPAHSEEVITALGSYTGTMPTVSGTDGIEALTAVGQTTGAIVTPGGLFNLLGGEFGAQIASTGGTVPNVYGSTDWARTLAGSTSNVTNLVSSYIQSPTKAGAGTIQNVYSLIVGGPASIATGFDYSIWNMANMLIGNTIGFNIDVLDSGGIARHIIQVDAANIVVFSAASTGQSVGDMRWKSQAGSDFMRFKSPNFEIDPYGAGFQLKLSTPQGSAPMSVLSTTPVLNLTVTRADSCTLTTGVAADASGFKHKRLTTGSVAANTDAAVTVNWTTAFADANYTVSCALVDATASASALKIIHIDSYTAASVIVRVRNDSAGALTGTLHVIAVHD
jgi:hypothetical protein